MNGIRQRIAQRHSRLPAIGLIALLASSCLVVRPARASMDLILADTPDIFSSFIDLSYDDPVDDLLQADGYAYQLKDNAGVTRNIQSADNPFAPGSFTLRATIDASGQLQSGGTVDFGGVVPDLGYTSGSILTGNVTALGYGQASEPLEFLFEVTGGDAAELFGGVSAVAGLILHTRAFPGDFSGPFYNDDGTSNAGHVVPEPATTVIWPLLGTAAAAFTWRRRRRSRA